MANDINTTTIVGRLTRDPEMRSTNSGSAVASLSIATNRQWKDSQSGETREEVSFIDCVAFGRLAEILGQYAAKGKQLAIQGRLKQDRWEDSEGSKRSRVQIVCDQVQLLGAPTGAADGTPASSSADDDDIPF